MTTVGVRAAGSAYISTVGPLYVIDFTVRNVCRILFLKMLVDVVYTYQLQHMKITK